MGDYVFDPKAPSTVFSSSRGTAAQAKSGYAGAGYFDRLEREVSVHVNGTLVSPPLSVSDVCCFSSAFFFCLCSGGGEHRW